MQTYAFSCWFSILEDINFQVIFLYLSKDYNRQELFVLLDKWMEEDVPTAVLGDINENILKLKKISFEKKMREKGFHQLLKKPTCETGSLIDHLYVNSSMMRKDIKTDSEVAFYSDP